jgi:hypothetical protein
MSLFWTLVSDMWVWGLVATGGFIILKSVTRASKKIVQRNEVYRNEAIEPERKIIAIFPIEDQGIGE